MSLFRSTTVHNTDLGHDAWGRSKAITDKSLFNGLFSFDVPASQWKELQWDGSDYIEKPAFVNATSVEGSLHLTTSANVGENTELRSKHHHRYQANRGHLYSSSIFLPNPNAQSTRRFGLMLPCNGVFLELVGTGSSYTLNLVVRNHFVDTPYDITSFIPAGVDLSKGNLFDIQMQWRGVGDFTVFINQERIFTTSELGLRDKVSIENPSLPVGFELINDGDESKIVCGCVDVTSEGGSGVQARYASFSTGESLVSTPAASSAVLAIRMPYKINYGGNDVCYSRDAILNQVSTFCKDEATVAIYGGRAVNLTALPALTWETRPDTHIEFLVGGTGSALDTAFQTDKASLGGMVFLRQEKDFLVRTANPNPEATELRLTANDYLIIVVDPDAATASGVTIEVSEQI